MNLGGTAPRRGLAVADQPRVRARAASAAKASIAIARSASSVSSWRAWLIPPFDGAKTIAAGQHAGDLGRVVEGAARELAGSPATSAQASRAANTSPVSNGIGSIRQTGCSSSSQPRSAAASPHGGAGGLEHRAPAPRRRGGAGRRRARPRRRPRSGCPGSSAQLAGGRDAAVRRPAIRSTASAASAAARPASRRASIGVVPACEAWPAKPKPQPLDPGAAGDRRARAGPRPRAPGPARCAARGRRRAPPRRAPRLGRAVELDAVLGRAPRRSPRPSASRSPSSAAGSRVPAKAELPNRLRPKRAPSSSAQSTSTSARGGGSGRSAQARSTPSAGHHAERAVEPAAVRDRVEVRAERERRRRAVGALEPRPEVAGLVGLGRRPRSRPATRSEEPRASRPPRPPAEALGAAVVAGAPRRARAGRRSPGRRRSPAPCSPSLSPPLAAQRLGEAVGAAAAEREHRQVGVEDLEPERAQLLVEASPSPRSRAPARRRARSR